MGVDKRAVLVADVDLEAVYREYKGAVEARVCSVLGEKTQNTEDLVSRIFIDFTRFVKSGKFRGDSKPQAALFTITNWRIADFFREKKREKENYINRAREEANRIQIKNPEFTCNFEIRSLFTQVIDALEILSPREREVFWWHGVAEENVTDLAKRMGISEGSIVNLYSQAKKKLAVAIRGAVKGGASAMSEKDKIEWLDKFYYAYLRLGEKRGHLTDGIKLAAAQAHVAIRSGCKDG